MTTDPVPCTAPWDGAAVHFGGDVQPCTTLCHDDCAGSLMLGNLNEQSLSEILDGPRARALRRRLLDGDLDGLCCSHCDRACTCNLYGDPVDGKASRARILDDGAVSAADGEAPWPLMRLELCLTDLCNMRCEMCPLTHGRASSRGMAERGFLPPAMVESCLRDIDGPLAGAAEVGVWLHWIGEPLLHPRFEDIVDRIVAAGERFRVHLVTNAIALAPRLSDRLLDKPGRHSLSASLNALTAEAYQRVNGSDQRDRVYDNLRHFLERRQALSREAAWPVSVSAVVVAGNLVEIPAFVRTWERSFAEHGSPSAVGLNGVCANTPAKIFLLTEVERPESRALFREALRQLEIGAADWPTGPTRAADAWVVAHALGEPAPAVLPDRAEGLGLREFGALADALYEAGQGACVRALAEDALLRRGAEPAVLYHLHRHRDHAAVVDLATQALSRQAARPYLLWIRGAARGCLGDGRGLEDLEACLAGGGIDGFADAVHDSLAEAYLARGDHPRAERHARAALAIMPDKAQTQSLLEGIEIDALYAAGEQEQARVRVARALEGAGAEPQRLYWLHRNHDFTAVVTQASRLLERRPGEPYALWIRGAAYAALGEMARAQADLEACLAGGGIDGFADAVHDSLTELYAARGDRQRATQHAELALAIAPGKQQTRTLLEGIEVDALYAAGKVEAARARVARALESPLAEARLLFLLHRNRDHRAVVEQASRLLERRPGEPYALWIRGAARTVLADLDGAQADLEACLAGGGIRGFADAVHDSLAELFLARQDRVRAREHAERALAIAPHKAQTRTLLEGLEVDALFAAGDREGARARVRSALEQPGAEARLLGLLNRNRDFAVAVECANRWLEQRPDEAYALWIRGAARAELGELDAAQADLERCLALGDAVSAFADAVHGSLAELFRDRCDSARAREHAQRALDLAPHAAQARWLLEGLEIDALYAAGRAEEARARVAGALEAPSAEARSLFLLHRNGDFTAVVTQASRLLERRPDEAYALWIRGAARAKLGELDAAQVDLERCLEQGDAIAGFADAVHDSLAELFLQRGDRTRAIAHAEQALAVAPHKAQTQALLERARKRQ